MNTKLSENIRKYRCEKNLTQEKLAEALGVSLSAVSKWETGAAAPSLDMLPQIADLFGISIDLLMSYECHQKSLKDYTGQIKALCEEKQFDACSSVAEQALRRFPNSFDLSYTSAQMYYLKGVESQNVAALNKSIRLYYRALELESQNKDPSVNFWTIQNDIAQVHLCIGNVEKALQILSENNASGYNDQAIGYALSCHARRGDEAKPYLSRALVASLMQIDRVVVAYSNAFEQAGQYEEIIRITQKLIEIYEIFRIPGKVSYLDKLEAKAYATLAQIYRYLGKKEEAEENLRKAKEFAVLFDSDPQYNFRNMLLCSDSSDLMIPFDDFGKTAMEGVEKTMYERKLDAEATRLVFGKLK